MVCARTRSMAVGVEARLGERQAQQLEGLVGVLHEGLQRAADGVVAGIEGQLDRAGGKPLLEGVGIVVARAFVEEPRTASARRPACRPGPAPSRPRR